MHDVRQLPIDKLRAFEGHPYNVIDNEEMDTLAESIMKQGVLSPIIVRPVENGMYEVISGHRRLRTSQIAGFRSVPALICEMDRDEAAIALVDSNLHRDHLLPSEKAFAYRLKLEAIKHQGKHSELSTRPSAEFVSPIDSGRQVQRFIRLTYLIPELLKMVDESIIAFTPAINLSCLTDEEQRWVFDSMIKNDCTPSLAQAMWFRERSAAEKLTQEHVFALLNQTKSNQRESVKIPMELLKGKIPNEYTLKQSEEFILKACDFYSKHLQRKKEERL